MSENKRPFLWSISQVNGVGQGGMCELYETIYYHPVILITVQRDKLRQTVSFKYLHLKYRSTVNDILLRSGLLEISVCVGKAKVYLISLWTDSQSS